MTSSSEDGKMAVVNLYTSGYSSFSNSSTFVPNPDPVPNNNKIWYNTPCYLHIQGVLWWRKGPHTCTHACTHARMHAHMHACTYARMHTCTYARTHACTHTHTTEKIYLPLGFQSMAMVAYGISTEFFFY